MLKARGSRAGTAPERSQARATKLRWGMSKSGSGPREKGAPAKQKRECFTQKNSSLLRKAKSHTSTALRRVPLLAHVVVALGVSKWTSQMHKGICICPTVRRFFFSHVACHNTDRGPRLSRDCPKQKKLSPFVCCPPKTLKPKKILAAGI